MNSPNLKFVFQHPAHFLAFGFGSGLSPIGPGTAGTLLAVPIFWWLNPLLSSERFLLFLAVSFIVGVWVCGKTGRTLGVSDHRGMVWDETVAFLLVLFFTPLLWKWQLAAFILFRLFDIFKPPPIHYFDQHIKGGFGVMFDDVFAAFYTLLCLALWKTLVG